MLRIPTPNTLIILLTTGAALVGGTAEAAQCAVLELEVTGPKQPSRLLSIRLSDTLSAEIRAAGLCDEVVVLPIEDFDRGCATDDACLMALAADRDVDLIAAGILRPLDAEALLQLRLFDRAQGFSISTVQTRTGWEALTLGASVVDLAGRLLDTQVQASILTTPEPLPEPEPEPEPEPAAVFEFDTEPDLEFDSEPPERAPEPVVAAEPDPEPEPSAADSETELPSVAENDLVARTRDVEVKNRPVTRCVVGIASYNLAHYDLGFELNIPISESGFIDLGTGAWIGLSPRVGESDPWTYALIPAHLGWGLRSLSSNTAQFFASLSATGLLYYTGPNLPDAPLSDLAPRIAPGLQLRGGMDLLAGEKRGVFVGGNVGVVWSPDIDVLVDPDYREIGLHYAIQTGLIRRF